MYFLLIFFVLWTIKLDAQIALSSAGMEWSCIRQGDDLMMELSAPTKGWIAVGFNNEDNIVGSDLIMFHIEDGKAEVRDMYVKGFGDPREDHTLGGSQNIEIIQAEESGHKTYVRFRRPLSSQDNYDYQLRNGETFWLILAYATHDDFAHHSRMRKHTQVAFKVE